MELKCKTISGSDPRGKPRVFFTCHPDDFDSVFKPLSDDILKHVNCAVYYSADPSEQYEEGEAEEILGQMQLIVIAVTSRFLHEENRAMKTDLPFALEHRIPVLPVMMEDNLEREFNKLFDMNNEIHLVSRKVTNPAAKPYDEVLETFLNSVLIGNELAEKVRNAFDAYVFLSYRRTDKSEALRLRHLIHENREFRDIAVWFDDFLVPGEPFYDAIMKALDKSSMFTMVVTNALETEGNFVMKEEYPRARHRKNETGAYPVIPVEMYESTHPDRRITPEKLRGKEFEFEDIEDLRDEHRKNELRTTFVRALEHAAKNQNDGSAQHRFFIGLAYLSSIDSEYNPELALKLITSAAEDPDPCPEAAEKLADMYERGHAVKADIITAAKWQAKLCDIYLGKYEEDHDPDHHKGYGTLYFKALTKLSQLQKETGDLKTAAKTAQDALAFSDVLVQETGIREQERDNALILNHLGCLYNDLNEQRKAKNCWKTAAEIYEKLSEDISTERSRRDLSASYIHLGDLCRREKNYKAARTYFEKARDILVELNEDDPSPERRRDISAVLTKLGNLCKSENDTKGALRFYKEAHDMDKTLLDELKTPQAKDDLAVSKVKIGDIYVMEANDLMASVYYEEALGLFHENLKMTDAWLYRDHCASCCEKLASLRKKQNNHEQAALLYQEAVTVRQQLYLATGLPEDGRALLESYVNSHEYTAGSISKHAVKEDISAYRRPMKKAGSLMDRRQTPITTESIRKGDVILGTYTVVSDAYSGRMGDVWKVHHNKWNIDLAMKRPQPAYFTECSDEVRADFIRECENWIGLGLHPDIVSCYYVREVGGVPTIFSEWMDRGSLNEWITDRTLYQGTDEEIQARILDIAIQMAAGLGYSHRNGIVHQDVKPENIMMTGETEARVADFGLARAQSQLQNSASFGFTEKFCPKEQTEGIAARPWMDVYAWALTVLYMYAGYPLWQTGAQAKEEMEQYRERCHVKVPEDVWQLLSSCIKDKRSDFEQIENRLREIYERLFDAQYFRLKAETTVSNADTLNNLALSYADLGMKDEAQRCWQAALHADPSHAESVISYGLYLWRSGIIDDRDMEKRIHRAGNLYSIRRDEDGEKKYEEMLQQFYAETAMSYLTGYGIPLDISRDIIPGKDPEQSGNRFRINNARVNGDVISFDMHEKRDGRIVHVVRCYRVSDGEFISEEDGDAMPKTVWGPAPVKEEGIEKDYLFSLQKTDLGEYGWDRGEGMVMLVKEPGSRRTLCTVAIRECGYWPGRIPTQDDYLKKHYPLLFADYENRRLVFVPLNVPVSHPGWAVYEMPPLSRNPFRMPDLLSVPKSYKNQAGYNFLRKLFTDKFAEAQKTGDIANMAETYRRTWFLPITEDHQPNIAMNAKMMNECRLPGVYKIDEWQEIRIYENEYGDPYPSGINAVFTYESAEEDPVFDQLEGLQDGAVHDGAGMTFCYVPWSEDPGGQPHGLRVFCYDRQADKTSNRYVGYELKDRYISRVLAAGNEGNTLLLELREDDNQLSRRQSSEKGSYTIAWADRRGKIIKEVFHGTGKNPYHAQLIEEDSNIGPYRIYLFEPGNPYHLYCEPEYDDECMESRDIELYCMHEGHSYRDNVRLPEPLTPDEWYEYNPRVSRQTIEKAVISGFGNGMIIMASETNQLGKRTNMWVYSAVKRQWMLFEGVLRRKGKIIISSDLRYILTGVPGHSGISWSWELYTSKPEEKNWDFGGVKYSKKSPLWTFEEYASETRIASFSSDRCWLLDEKGKPVYALCWKYEKQKEEPDESLFW